MKRIILIMGTLILLTGCSKVVYSGKYITVETRELPMDEWKLGDYVVLSWENQNKRQEDKWVYRFEVYRRETLVGEYLLRSEKVDAKRYYLKVEEEDRLKTIASFDAKPQYRAVRDRMIAALKAD